MFAPTTYREMLTRLNWFTAVGTFLYVATITRLGFIPQIAVDHGLIPPIKDTNDLLNWASSFGLVALGAGVAAFVLSWAFEMHNIVSKLSQLRYFWDRYFIVKPLAKIAGSSDSISRATVRSVMNDFYYDWTRKIDQHYVQLFWRYALPFWILFEHLIVIAISIVALASLQTPHLWKLIAYFFAMLVATAAQFLLVTVKKTKDQVAQIPAQEVRAYFRKRSVIARI